MERVGEYGRDRIRRERDVRRRDREGCLIMKLRVYVCASLYLSIRKKEFIVFHSP